MAWRHPRRTNCKALEPRERRPNSTLANRGTGFSQILPGAIASETLERMHPAAGTPSMIGDRHKRLREATHEAHCAAERIVEAAGYFEDCHRYACYLARMHLFYRKLFQACQQSERMQLEQWHIPQRIAQLEADLADLGQQPLPFDAPIAPSMTRISASGLLGILYVILGATLGARVLLAQTRQLALPDGRGQRYLTDLAHSDAWPRFLKCLEAEPVDVDRILVPAAIATFQAITDHLAEPAMI